MGRIHSNPIASQHVQFNWLYCLHSFTFSLSSISLSDWIQQKKMLFICYTTLFLKNHNGYTFSVELYYVFLVSIQDTWQYVILLLWNPLRTPPSPLFLLTNPHVNPTWVICTLLSGLSSYCFRHWEGNFITLKVSQWNNTQPNIQYLKHYICIK